MAKTAISVLVVVATIAAVTVFVVAGALDRSVPTGTSLITAEASVVRVSIQPGSSDAGKVCADENRCHYAPQTVTIGVGDTAIWKNEDETAHGIAGMLETDNGFVYAFETPKQLMPGDEFSHRFKEAGNYSYYGIPGPWKTGKVVVEE